ncbi:hypothetical protein ACYQR9_20970 [Methylobacterium sp. CM6241]|nr:hypothetical protein [Methylobacterium sp. Leaf86]
MPNNETLLTANDTATTRTLKQALAAKVGDRVEIVAEGEDGTTFKLMASE